MDVDRAIQTWEDQLRSGSPFRDDDENTDFLRPPLPKLPEPYEGFATTQPTPGPTHARQILTSPSFSPPEHHAFNTAPARLVFDKNAKKAFLQTVKAVTEKRDTVTYDLLLKQYQCLAHHVLQFRNIKPSDTIQVERPGGKEKLHLNTVTFSAYLLKMCQTNLKESKRNAKKDNQDTM